MTSANPSDNLNLGRGWLNRAAEMLDSCEDHVSDAEFARAAAAIGNGFIALAHAERAAASMAEVSQVRQAILTMSDEPLTLGERCERHPDSETCAVCTSVAMPASGQREQRAEAEARPHDDEPEMTLGEALRHPLPGDSVPDDEPKHALAPGVVWIAADANGPIHAAVSQALAQTWATENEGDFEGLSVTALAVDRG